MHAAPALRSVAAVAALLVSPCAADLRMASQPKNGYKVNERSHYVPFVSSNASKVTIFRETYSVYMEPSDFGYKKLMKQRDGGGYDNFLRSNIDNEQDKRNFQNESGRDHLPFRSYESAETDAHASQKHKIPAAGPGPALTVKPGVPTIVPLRWNNPHSSELEVNVWIMDNKYVVPIRKPTCSGEGHQDDAFTFTIPYDFADLGKKVPGFRGCRRPGDCVLQIYAHSVESRMYAIGTPLVVDATYPTPTATGVGNIQAATVDVGIDLNKLKITTCLPSSDASANIRNAVPRAARLVSDQFTHAYQNSDYSPYAGQQPDAISRNMQASCILKMVTGNRGELGKHKLAKDNRTKYNFLRQIERQAKEMVRVYEGIANQIISAVGANMANNDSSMKPDDIYTYQTRNTCDNTGVNPKAITTLSACQAGCAAMGMPFNGTLNYTNFPQNCFVSRHDWKPRNQKHIHKGHCYFNTGNGTWKNGNRCDGGHRKCLCQTHQNTDTCFRCAEVGAITKRRLTTNTYVPSFRIPKAMMPTAKLYIAPIYKGFLRQLSNGDGVLLIYETVLENMNTQFAKAGAMGLGYMGPALKTTLSTMADATNFIKVDATGKADRGYYAATQAQANIEQIMIPLSSGSSGRRLQASGSPPTTAKELLDKASSGDDSDGGIFIADMNMDMNGVGFDSTCDDDAKNDFNTTANCSYPGMDKPSPWQMFADAGQVEGAATSASANQQLGSIAIEGEDGGSGSFWMVLCVLFLLAIPAGAAYYAYERDLWPCLKKTRGSAKSAAADATNPNTPAAQSHQLQPLAPAPHNPRVQRASTPPRSGRP